MSQQIEENVIGVLLNSNPTELTDYISRLKKEYFLNAFNRDVFVSIEYLFSRGVKPDMVAVFDYFKKKGSFDKRLAVRISQLTTKAPILLHEIDSTFNVIHANYNKSLVGNFLQKSTKKFNEDTITLDGFIEDLKNLESSIEFDTTPEQTNAEVIDEILADHDKAKQGEMPGIGIGIAILSDIIMLEPVDVFVIGAKPAMGKTALAVTVAKNLVLAENKVVALFCIEQSHKQLMRRLVANMVGVNSAKIRKGGCAETDIQKVSSVKSTVNLENVHIFTGSHTVADITAKCSSLKHNKGLDLIIIDYVQKVTSTLSSSTSETERVKQVANDLKRMTQRMEVPQIQFSQLNKDSSRDGKRPVLADLKQTGDIEQDASIVAFLHRPEYYGQKSMPGAGDRSSRGLCEVIVAKNREDELGIKELVFEPWYSRFSSNYGTTTKTDTSTEKEKDKDLPF